MSIAFDIAANENFESLRKANQKIKNEKLIIDSNKNHKIDITTSFKDKKFVFLSNEFNLKNNRTNNIFGNKEKDKLNEGKSISKIRQLKALRNENNIEPVKILENKSKIKKEIKKENEKKNIKVKMNKIKNLNTKTKKLNCLNDEKIINIKIKLNPLNIRKNFNINVSNSNIINSMNKTEKIGFKYCLNNFDRMGNNFLSMRKTLDIFNSQETKKINHNYGYNPNFKSSNNHQYIENNQNENTRYSKYFLPSSGFWLYSKDKNEM